MAKIAGKAVVKTGRASTFSDECAQAICDRIAIGESVVSICKDDAMPTQTTVYKWLNQYPEFAKKYAQARVLSADFMLEQIIAISDDSRGDYSPDNYNKGKTPGYEFNGEHVMRSRLMVDTRKWAMSKLMPKKYGDKIDMTTNGKDVVMPILGTLTPPIAEEITPPEI